MSRVNNFIEKNPIPKGYKIWRDRLQVAGIQFRKSDALWLAGRKEAWIELQPDRRNKHDSNALKVFGCAKGLFGVKRRFVGFVPAETALEVAENGTLEELVPRLTRAYVGSNGYTEIWFQLLEPK